MADAGDSKSPGGNPVRVRLSPRAPTAVSLRSFLLLAYGSIGRRDLGKTHLLSQRPDAGIVARAVGIREKEVDVGGIGITPIDSSLHPLERALDVTARYRQLRDVARRHICGTSTRGQGLM